MIRIPSEQRERILAHARAVALIRDHAAELSTCAGPRLLPDGGWCVHDFAPVFSCPKIPQALEGADMENIGCKRCGAVVSP